MDVLGRDGELGRIGAWVSADPAPAVLAIEGEPGIGKTTLWAEGIRRAREAGWQVLSCRPAPSDAALSHVGLADLLRPVPEQAFGGLASPQRRALAVALLREEASEGDLDPRAVGTGLTALLTVLAGQAKLMLAIDDAQWLDPASARAIAFALRRMDSQPVRLLTAVRVEGPGKRRPAGLTALDAAADHRDTARLLVGPLTVAATHHLCRQVLGASFPRPLLVRVHRAAGGNPFYALEIAREIQRVGVPQTGQPLPVPDDHRNLALLRLRRLPPATRGVSVEHGEAALALLDKDSDPALYGFALHNLALFKLYTGRGADHAAIEEGTRLGQDAAVWEMSTVPAFWARNFDDFDTARQRFEDIIGVFREYGDEASVSAALTHLAVIEAMTGHMDRAGELAAEALDLAEQTEQETFLTMGLWARAQVLTQAGDLPGARAACGVRRDHALARRPPRHRAGGHGQGGARPGRAVRGRPRRGRPAAVPVRRDQCRPARPRTGQRAVPRRPRRGGHRAR